MLRSLRSEKQQNFIVVEAAVSVAIVLSVEVLALTLQPFAIRRILTDLSIRLIIRVQLDMQFIISEYEEHTRS